ncbi:MAG TPA: hypothetical protein P5034_06585 [Rectinema sp.]|nr:hypothetical protein [Rectinema sp.]HRU77967.1 hypothetical protein [Rectinema sp.]
MKRYSAIYLKPLTSEPQNDSQPFFYASGNGTLVYRENESAAPKKVTTKEAEEIIKDAGYIPVSIDWSVLIGFDQEKQKVFDLTGRSPEEIEETVELYERLGISVVPWITTEFPNITKWLVEGKEEDFRSFQGRDREDEDCLVIFYNVEEKYAKVKVFPPKEK